MTFMLLLFFLTAGRLESPMGFDQGTSEGWKPATEKPEEFFLESLSLLIWNKDDGNFNSPVYGAIAHTPHRHATWGSMTLTTITFPSASETKRFPPGWGQQCVLGAPNKEFLIRLPLAALWSQMIWGFFLPEFYTILLHFFPGKIY